MTDRQMLYTLRNEPDNINLIDSEQWDRSWARTNAPRRLRPWRDYLSWRLARLFSSHIKPGDHVLEVGCGGSRFLPYFAKDLRAEVYGFDFAPSGVENAKTALRRAGVTGTILQGDLFDAPVFPVDHFDVVFSGGFIEHFQDTYDVVKRIAHFAKPRSGVIITAIPNVTGWFFSKVQKRLDPELYGQHVAISAELMDSAHVKAGAEPIRSAHYFGTLALSVLNYDRVLPSSFISAFRRCVEIPQFMLTAVPWALRVKPESAALSPFLVGIYRRTTS